ncbi:DNA topoisomerase 4 subunit A [Lachnoanaerobaculum sp. Marseille-Q4761]|uniref:DNA gyrase/topoisomerase IV subunit A n=1 Tax=Lachnoanaerobaculum sp. Marseille-Q4761 TaxID=2819511 RepID=UPI001AA1559D|nr:DNA topoisomerase (ATP-hydrolyzing) [Lachnoanaerobaculum sp. Marseille-Q4761]MBO1870904.1 DNA topoisomerase 4 subunit A [Lachnoanaerobaculum sp. Marseille-Q4761]
MAEKILRTEYSEEMQKSYLDYSMSVITARAIPDARDGLKPVQRRVLYDMSELRIFSDRPHRKSARIVGDTMGKYHPHGDSSIYETLVVLSQDFKKGMALIDGHGNFGSIEGDGAAAMRYTEAKLSKFTEEVYLKDLDKTVDFISNYDETEKEPAVLPVRVPNLLINGAEGIAVGMSTSIPTHNLLEVCNTCIAYIKNRNIDTKGLLEILHGPDFPTGGIIANKKDLFDIYDTGNGKLKIRGKIEVELGRKKSDKDKLIISEIPYTMIGAGINKFLVDVANLVESKKLSDVVDISNQSDKNGTRIVLELKKDADIEKIKNILYKKTKLEDTFGVNMLAIVDGRPEILSLRDILKNYLDFQYEITTKKYNILLNKELEKKEIQEGLIRAVDVIDLIIAILRGSKNLTQAKKCLISGDTTGINFTVKAFEKDAKKLSFTEKQAQAILDMRLYKLIGLEIEALLKDNAATLKNIEDYENILKDHKNMDKLFIKDLEKIKRDFALPRKTLIEDAKEAVYIEEPLASEEVIFVMDKFGYCKVYDRGTFDKNAQAVESENIYVFPVMNTDKVCIFSNTGILYKIKVMDLPISKLRDKGTPIDNLTKFDSSTEEILLAVSEDSMRGNYILMLTKNGFIKKISCEEFKTNNKQVASTKLTNDDVLIAVKMISSGINTDIFIISDAGYILRFNISEVNEFKKSTRGEKAMTLGYNEYIKELYLLNDTGFVNISGKEIALNKVKPSHRGYKGQKIK